MKNLFAKFIFSNALKFFIFRRNETFTDQKILVNFHYLIFSKL